MMEEGRSEDIILMDRRRRIGLGQRLEKLILSISYVERVPYHRGESDIPLSACRCRTTMHLPRGNNHRLVACAFIHFAASLQDLAGLLLLLLLEMRTNKLRVQDHSLGRVRRTGGTIGVRRCFGGKSPAHGGKVS